MSVPRLSAAAAPRLSAAAARFSTGEAEFNWRMIWPIFLPEKVPRLFMQARIPPTSPPAHVPAPHTPMGLRARSVR